MKRILLLDLEETTIPIWGDWWPLPEDCRKIKKFIEEFDPHEVRTFSWAIWNDEDKEIFNKNKHVIENAIGRKFDFVDTIEDFKTAIEVLKHLKMTTNDFFDFFKKENALFELVLAGHFQKRTNGQARVVLIDDAVIECSIEAGRTDARVLNIKRM